MSPETRAMLITLRSVLLRAVDMIELACEIGKHAPSKPVTRSPSDSMAGIIEAPARVNTTVDQP